MLPASCSASIASGTSTIAPTLTVKKHVEAGTFGHLINVESRLGRLYRATRISTGGVVAIKELRDVADWQRWANVGIQEQLCEKMEALRTADVVMPTVSDRITAEVLSAEPMRCKILGNFGVGFNHIDIKAARERGVAVTNTPAVLTDPGALADTTGFSPDLASPSFSSDSSAPARI